MYLFILQNAISCVVFVLAFLAGGITNVIYATENSGLRYDLCDDFSTYGNDEFCGPLERVVIAEAIAAVS